MRLILIAAFVIPALAIAQTGAKGRCAENRQPFSPAAGRSFDGGGPAIPDGMVITTCGYGFGGRIAGNVLLAFSVDGK
jgi:hypothetical protein